MACVTLKRSMDFDPLHSSPKRRRCVPIQRSISKVNATSCGGTTTTSPSPFTSAAPTLSSDSIAAQISAEVKRLQRRKHLSAASSCTDISMNIHNQTGVAKSSSNSSNEVSDGMDSGDASPERQTSSPGVSTSRVPAPALSPNRRDVPLFTFRQVNLLCERLIKEREQVVREHYDEALSSKLSEQYEAFLKFNHDMLQKRFSGSTPSYVS